MYTCRYYLLATFLGGITPGFVYKYALASGVESDTEQPDAEKGTAITTSNSSSNAAARPPGGLSRRTLLVDA